ncbi:MAG: efflux RND transporter permease subunit, partial [Nocardioidaceae bacterium]
VRRGLDQAAERSVARPVVAGVVLVVLALLAVPGLLALGSGSVLPAAQDRSLVIHLDAAPGTSLTEMNRVTTAAAQELRRVPGISSADTHVGRAIASDQITDVNSSDIWVRIADDADYTRTLDTIRTTIHGYPGLRSDVQTYEAGQLATAGATTGDQLVVRVYGEDYATLQSTAEAVRQEIQTVAGVISPKVQRQVTEPTIQIQVDLAAAQRFGLRPGDVRRDASTLISGLTVGSLYEQQAIFDVVLWTGPPSRASVDSLQSLLLDTPDGGKVRLGDIAQVRLAASPNVITHDAVQRSLDVTAQVRGRSAAAVSQDVTTHLQRMDYPYEYRAEVVGDAVSRAQTRQLVLISGLIVLFLAYLLLQAATGSWRGGALLLVLVPFAGVGALLAAQLTGGALTAGVLAALFAVVALALRQSLLLVRRAQRLRDDDVEAASAMRRALREKAPSVIGVALATGAFFLPAALMGNDAGLELLQPFAITLIAGLVSTLAVVLFVVPGLYPRLVGLQPSPLPADASPDEPMPVPHDAEPAAAVPAPRQQPPQTHEEVQP